MDTCERARMCTYMRVYRSIFVFNMCERTVSTNARYLRSSNRHFALTFSVSNVDSIKDHKSYSIIISCALFLPSSSSSFSSFSCRFILRCSLLARCCYTQNLHKNHLSFSSVRKSRGDEGIMPTFEERMWMT